MVHVSVRKTSGAIQPRDNQGNVMETELDSANVRCVFANDRAGTFRDEIGQSIVRWDSEMVTFDGARHRKDERSGTHSQTDRETEQKHTNVDRANFTLGYRFSELRQVDRDLTKRWEQCNMGRREG